MLNFISVNLPIFEMGEREKKKKEWEKMRRDIFNVRTVEKKGIYLLSCFEMWFFFFLQFTVKAFQSACTWSTITTFNSENSECFIINPHAKEYTTLALHNGAHNKSTMVGFRARPHTHRDYANGWSFSLSPTSERSKTEPNVPNERRKKNDAMEHERDAQKTQFEVDKWAEFFCRTRMRLNAVCLFFDETF